MIRGTTPTLTFKLPFDTSDIAYLNIAIAQDNVLIIEKGADDCEFNEADIIVKLTQEDTLKLCPGKTAEIQLRIKTNDGNALASKIKKVSVNKILKDGAI